MKTKESIQAELTAAIKLVETLKAESRAFDALPENNVFTDLERAANYVECELENMANEDCEGSYNCGESIYKREFTVNDVKYLGLLSVDYNRHDKTYYYIDSTDFTYTLVSDGS